MRYQSQESPVQEESKVGINWRSSIDDGRLWKKTVIGRERNTSFRKYDTDQIANEVMNDEGKADWTLENQKKLQQEKILSS